MKRYEVVRGYLAAPLILGMIYPNLLQYNPIKIYIFMWSSNFLTLKITIAVPTATFKAAITIVEKHHYI